jgi:hypothetical protein
VEPRRPLRRINDVVRKLWALVALALLFPAAAPAKWMGDLRMCGASGCRTIERHLGHDHWPLLSALSTWPSTEGPARPAAFYRITIVQLDSRGRPDLDAQSPPIYFVPSARLARNEDGRGGIFWTRLDRIPDRLAKTARTLRPFPAPRLTRVVVGDRVAKAPQSYLRLLRLPAPRRRARDPAGPKPGELPTTGEVVSYWERVRRLYKPVSVFSRRETPWTDFNASLWVGRRLDLIMRDGEIVPIPHSLAERVRRGQSLR